MKGAIFIIALLTIVAGLEAKLLIVAGADNVALTQQVHQLKVDSVNTVWQHKDELESAAKELNEMRLLAEFRKCVIVTTTGKLKYYKNKAKNCK